MSATTGPRAHESAIPIPIHAIPLSFDPSDGNASALQLVYALDSDWKDSEGDVTFVRFTDGITNTLTKATKQRPGKSKSEIDSEAILIRAYGNGTDVLIDREREMKAHNLLADLGLAPPLLARFKNGLMYRFVEGTVCTPEDLRRPEIYRAVAQQLARWHSSLPISAITNTPQLSGESEGQHCAPQDGKNTRPSPNIWTVVQQWIEALPRDDDVKKERVQTLNTELTWLSDKLGHAPAPDGKEYVFSHCDLLSGNVIIAPRSPSADSANDHAVSFIDYEYATPAPAAFDIANHLAEWAGFECDYAAVPTKSQRRDFLHNYVVSYRMNAISDQAQTLEVDMKKEIDTLYEQVDLFRGLPGFYWGIWALIQTTISQIDFDYASYAEKRLGEYWGWKAELTGSRQREGKDMTVRESRWAEE